MDLLEQVEVIRTMTESTKKSRIDEWFHVDTPERRNEEVNVAFRPIGRP
jgi:hypothetical protein